MNTVEELRAFLESQGFNPLLLLDGPEAQEIIEEIFNANMFFSNVADGNTYEFSDDELRNYLSEAFDGGEAVIGPDLIKALRIAQIFWNSDYTPEQQEDMTKFFNNMYESFEDGQLYPTLEENITFYEQVRATVSGEQPIQEAQPQPQPQEVVGSGVPYDPDITFDYPPSQLPYIPGANGTLGGFNWLDLWGDDDPIVEQFFDDWVERFNENTGEGATFAEQQEQLQSDFLYDPVHGLYSQPWWRDITDSVRNHLQFWYSSGGTGHHWGGSSGGIAGVADGNPYNSAMEEFRQIAIRAIEGAGLGDWIKDGTISSDDINRYAFKIMVQGGASYKMGLSAEGFTPEQFNTKATQIVETMVLNEFIDSETGMVLKPNKEFGVGSVTSLMNQWKTLAKSQFLDIPDSKLRKWALDVKTEQGLTKEQVDAKINKMAFQRVDFPFTQEERELHAASGATMEEILNPQWSAAVRLWEDTSIPHDDPWLMDNYTVEDGSGGRRFRTSAEMRQAARNHMPRFQHSSEAQDFFNSFISGVARMMRSDY